jgi:plastocyanin
VDAGGYFVDGGSTDQTITFSGDKYGGVYDPNCLKIKAGTTVTWNVPFVEHPLLGAPCNTNTGDQIPVVSTGATASLKFKTVGVYGYKCQFHGGGADTHAMKGVVVVY